METTEAIARAKEILRLAKVPSDEIASPRNFLDFGAAAFSAARALSNSQKANLPWFREWALKFRSDYDKFDKLVEADPMILYEPAHRVALEFHSSPALIRYNRSANRTSKTQSGYAEHYLVTTGQHRWRKFGPPPNSTVIVGVNFTQYKGGVFEKKFLTGEQDNPLSPMFPIGGKWFYHYNEKEREITIACPRCANQGKAGTCPHPKSTIKLFSDEGGWEVLQGRSDTLIHFDEHIDEGFFSEAKQRFKTVKFPSMIITGTPLFGYEAWEYRLVEKVFIEGPPLNLTDRDDPNSPPLVSLHHIDQFEAGLVPHDMIRSDMATMDEFEIESRIYGRPGHLAKNPVFDRQALIEYSKNVLPPQRGGLVLPEGASLITINPGDKVDFAQALDGPLRVWQQPEPGAIYVIAVDTAAGLIDRDASCASVLKCTLSPRGLNLEMVAQFHGWISPYDYAEEVMKLGVWYNSALVVVELTGGLGRAAILRLKELAYWNIYREPTDHAMIEMRLDPRLGIETSAQSKPFMVSALQKYIKDRRLKIYCDATVSELKAFEQTKTGAGGAALASPKYQGSGGSPDDRVMSLAIASAVAVSYQALIYEVQYAAEQAQMAGGRAPEDRPPPKMKEESYAD